MSSIGFLLGGVIGDVLGSQVEGWKKTDIDREYKGQVTNVKSDRYTDDTEMTLVLLRHLEKNSTIDSLKLIKEHAKEAKKYGYRGYSLRTRNLLIAALTSDPTPNESTTNGCLMRIGVMGLIDARIKGYPLLDCITRAIKYTHNTQEAIAVCYVHCKTISFIIREHPTKKTLIEKVLEYATRVSSYVYSKLRLMTLVLGMKTDESIESFISGNNDLFQIEAIDCLTTAYYYFFKNYDDPEKAIIEAASTGGDTDTVAKVTGELTGLVHGDKWIPDRWKNLEGWDELTSYGRKIDKQPHWK